MSINSTIETLSSSHDQDNRRQSALGAFRQYLSKRPNVLTDLGYTPGLQKYVSGSLKNLALPHHFTNRGLEARPSSDSTGTGPASLVESPAKGVAQFEATLPSNLDWHSRDQLTGVEINSLREIGALIRMTMLDTTLLEDGGESAIAKALHSGDRLPRFGLREASFLSQIARMLGQATTFNARRLNGTDIAIDLQRPSDQPRNEIWRELFSDNTLQVFGRVPQIRS